MTAGNTSAFAGYSEPGRNKFENTNLYEKSPEKSIYRKKKNRTIVRPVFVLDQSLDVR